MKLLEYIKNGALIILAVPLIVGVLIIASPFILFFVAQNLTAGAFKSLRKDPRDDVSSSYEIFKENHYPDSAQNLKQYFDEHIKLINEYCNNVEVTKYRFDEDEKEGPAVSVDDNSYAEISCTLTNASAAIKLRMRAERWGDDLYASSLNEEVPPYLEAQYIQANGIQTRFDVGSSSSMEFLLASVQSGQIKSDAGQIWAKRNDGIYIVNYSVMKKDSENLDYAYGYRHSFSNALVREYFYDKKISQ